MNTAETTMHEETVTEAKEAIQKKNESIENSTEKNKIRQDVIMQAKKCMMYQKTKIYRCLTLPAKKAYFEHALVHSVKREGIDVELHMTGVEMNFDIAIKTLKNMPANSVVAGDCSIQDVLEYECKSTPKSGVLELTQIKRATPLMFEFIWLDYCMIVTEKSIQHFIKTILENINQGYIAVTWDLKVRQEAHEDYARIFSGYKEGMTIHQAVVSTILKMLKKIGKEVNLVYNVEYGGGESGRTTMLTLGFSVNIPSGVVNPIEENFRDGQAAIKAARAGMINKFQTTGEWKVGTRGRKGSGVVKFTGEKNAVGRPKLYKSVEERQAIYRIENAVTKWEAKWKTLTKDKKISIATRYGKSLREFGCMVACRHGKHKANRDLKMAA